jgi:pimeloyl-ACP methyl ester carboxylesterase
MMIRFLLLTTLALAWTGTTLAQTCNGLAATIVGTAGDDEIVGTPGDDVIVGLGGSDRIQGLGGNDTICGGEGDDDLFGGAGDDLLLGEAGDDVLVGDDASDVGAGTAGVDTCDGGTGIDSAGLQCDTRLNIDASIFPLTLSADDGVPLAGALHVPTGDAAPGGPRRTAVLISHGAMGSWEFSVPEIWRLWGAQQGFTVLALDRRDAGMTGGGGTVLFEDAVTDLGAGIDLLAALGYQQIYLTGHSQGTQNAAIYPILTMDPRVVAIGLHGTVDDGRDTARNLLFNELILGPVNGYSGLVTLNEQLIADGDGDVLRNYATIFGVPLTRTPNNWMSFWGPDSLSVVVREIENLTIPALLLRAEGDDFTPDAMSQNVLAAATAASVDATYTVLPYVDREGNAIPLTDNGGNAHGFVGVERAMLDANVAWLEGKVAAAAERSTEFRAPADDGSGGNFRPLAYAGRTPATSGAAVIALDATGGRDIDGEIVAYLWTQVAGEMVMLDDPTSPTPSFDNPGVASQLEFELTVTDDDGATDTVPVALAVAAPPAPPGGDLQLPGSSGLGVGSLLLLLIAIRRRYAN